MATKKPLLSDLLKQNPRLLEAATKAHSKLAQSIGRLPAEKRALGQMISDVRRSAERGGKQS